LSSWEMEGQHQRALISCSSLGVAVAVAVVVWFAGVGVGATLGFLVMVVVCCGCGATFTISKELVGELRDVLEPLGRPFDPRVLAVALYLTGGTVAQTVLELDVHVIYDALMRYRRA